MSAQTLGAPAPAFTLKTLAGATVSLSDYAGRPVLLNFWASWCKPCRGEMSDIIAAYDANQDQHLEVLAINLTDQEHLSDARRFVDELHMPFPVLLDQKGKVHKSYALRGVPTSVFIDSQPPVWGDTESLNPRTCGLRSGRSPSTTATSTPTGSSSGASRQRPRHSFSASRSSSTFIPPTST